MLFVKTISGVLIFLLTTFNIKAARFPSYIQRCHQSDPDVKQCYVRTVNLIKSHFDSGIPEFYLPPMNPLTLSEITLENGDTFTATFKNIKIYHLKDLRVIDIDIDLSSNKIKINLIIPKLRIQSFYNIKGKIGFLQLNGNGPADGNFTNIQVEMELQGSRYKRGSKEYLKFSDMKIKERLHNPVFQFHGLFKGNPLLTEQTNKIMNDNIDEFLNELKPTIHGAIKQTTLSLISRMFEKFSVKDLFPQ